MPTKSDNTKGNPYHDENTGEFTSKDGVSSNGLKIKAGLSSEKLKELISNGATSAAVPLQTTSQPKKLINDDGSLTNVVNLEEANEQGAQILGEKDIVYYENIPVENAVEFNNALHDVYKDFGNTFKNGNLINYGVSDRTSFSNQADVQKKILENIFKKFGNDFYKEKYLSLTKSNFDGFLNQIKTNLGKYLKSFFKPLKSENIDGVSTHWAREKIQGEKLRMFSVVDSIRFNLVNCSKTYKENFSEISSHNSGFHLPINASIAYDTAAHELGHFIFNTLSKYIDDNDFLELKKILSLDKNGKKTSFSKLYEDKQISGYALSKDGGCKHIAEAFADVYSNGNNATVHNKRIVKFLKEINDRLK